MLGISSTNASCMLYVYTSWRTSACHLAQCACRRVTAVPACQQFATVCASLQVGSAYYRVYLKLVRVATVTLSSLTHDPRRFNRLLSPEQAAQAKMLLDAGVIVEFADESLFPDNQLQAAVGLALRYKRRS